MITEAQRAERRRGIGGSDAPVIAGVSPYKTPLELYHEKVGQGPLAAETPAMRWGTKLEPLVAEEFAAQTGWAIVEEPTTLIHPHYPWMRGHVDGWIFADRPTRGVLEVKTSRQGEAWADGIPDHVLLQVQHYLAVTGETWGAVAVFLFASQEVCWWLCERDEELITALIAREQEFWRHVEQQSPPPGPLTANLVRALYPASTERRLTEPDPEALAQVERWLRAKRARQEAEAEQDAAELWLKGRLGDAAGWTLPGYTVSWKSAKPARVFDTERFRREQPTIFSAYHTERPGSRRFGIKEDRS